MITSNGRILNPEQLPVHLWEPAYVEAGTSTKGLIRLPVALATAYSKVVHQSNLSALAQSRDQKNPPVGGFSQAEADKHFAQAFDGSSARAQLALLDPLNLATKASNNLVRTLAGNSVTLADAPSGAGAASFSLLCNIAELRKQGVLPREPLDVHLIGGEISRPARTYALQMAAQLSGVLEEQGITLEVEFHPWNVTDKLSNTDFIKKINSASPNQTKKLVVIANFNGFLIKERKQKDAAPQLEELFRYCSGKQSYALWIEPGMNRATNDGGVFAWLGKLIKSGWNKFASLVTDDQSSDPVSVYTSRFELPLDPPLTARVGLSFISLDLSR